MTTTVQQFREFMSKQTDIDLSHLDDYIGDNDDMTDDYQYVNDVPGWLTYTCDDLLADYKLYLTMID